GIEWSQQFCADPKKVDVLRRQARRLYAAFPGTIAAMEALSGRPDHPLQKMLDTEITTSEQVGDWVDSIFNASVPLCANLHTGVLKPSGDAAADALKLHGGVHHYPTPITDIQLFKYDDFRLWV